MKMPPDGGWEAQSSVSCSVLGGMLRTRVLYVGNSTDNGDFNSADLEKVRLAA